MMLALAGARNVRPALLMLGAAGALMRVGKKLSCSNLYCFIDTQGRGVLNPDEPACTKPFRQRQARP